MFFYKNIGNKNFNFNFNPMSVITGCLLISLGLGGLSVVYYRNYCCHSTFKYIDLNYKKKEDWEHELEIYSISMPRFYTVELKKKKCILLISGYKDIPFVWNEFEKYLIADGFDFFAPRTHGNGRSFFQIVNWKDWIITYLEAIYILQEQYETIDIIGFSTGVVIAIYLSQFKYKCKINNIFCCSPFLLHQDYLSIKVLFSQNLFSILLNRLCSWTLRFHPKSRGKYIGFRDTNHPTHSVNDYCEIFGDLETETTLFEFVKNFKPQQINANKVIILYPNEDTIIGDIDEQHKIISSIFSNGPVDLITIPSYLDLPNFEYKYYNHLPLPLQLPQICGHVMFKEHPEIIKNVYANIKKYF